MKDSPWWARLRKRWAYLRCSDCGVWLRKNYVMSELSLNSSGDCCRDCLRRRGSDQRRFIYMNGGGCSP
jgi:hypothetical protein